MAIKSYEQRLLEQTKQLAEKKKADIAASDKIFNSQEAETKKQYGAVRDESIADYENQYRDNAVQKIIDERNVKENLANMGLSASGYSADQTLAAQLSYANRKNNIDTNRQKTIDNIALQLSADLTNIRNNKSTARQNIESQYQQRAEANATSLYNADVKAETERQKLDYDKWKTQYNAGVQLQKAAISASGSKKSSKTSKSSKNINGNSVTKSLGNYFGVSRDDYDKLNEYLDNNDFENFIKFMNKYGEFLSDDDYNKWADLYSEKINASSSGRTREEIMRRNNYMTNTYR